MKIRALIIAHEPLARQEIRGVLRHEPQVEIIAECTDEHEAIAALERLRPNLLFTSSNNHIRTRKKYRERIAVKSPKCITFLRTNEVVWIEAEGNYVRLHLEGKAYLLQEKMKVLEAKLDPEQFIRIHRSTIVNVEFIKELRPLPKGKFVVVLRQGTQLTSSHSYRDTLLALVEKWS